MNTDRPNGTFIDAIAAILHEPMNGGLFKYEVTKPTGEKVAHQLSWAAGMGSLQAKYHYQKRFGVQPPIWTQSIHPRHMAQVCNLALDRNEFLPFEFSTISNLREKA